jgi:UDP-N-acetylglucosamine 1-carboxyvinyltransferase
MQTLVIMGGRKISGNIDISGSKNATLPILASTILTNKKVVLTNVPIVKDVETMVNLLKPLVICKKNSTTLQPNSTT